MIVLCSVVNIMLYHHKVLWFMPSSYRPEQSTVDMIYIHKAHARAGTYTPVYFAVVIDALDDFDLGTVLPVSTCLLRVLVIFPVLNGILEFHWRRNFRDHQIILVRL